MNEIEELYEKHSKGIFNYFYYQTYDVHLADELTQETFYQCVISIVNFKGDSSISTWLYGIARNVFLKSLKKKKIKTVEYEDKIFKGLSSKNDFNPESLTVRKEIVIDIKMIISKLPEKYSSILILRDKLELSYAEIGKITKISEAAVKVNIFRARKKFKEEYAKIVNKDLKGGL